MGTIQLTGWDVRAHTHDACGDDCPSFTHGCAACPACEPVHDLSSDDVPQWRPGDVIALGAGDYSTRYRLLFPLRKFGIDGWQAQRLSNRDPGETYPYPNWIAHQASSWVLVHRKGGAR